MDLYIKLFSIAWWIIALIFAIYYAMKIGADKKSQQLKNLENEILKKQRDNPITTVADARKLFAKLRK
jgi:hypothetical protein